jgi:hypothetical protein
VNGSINLVNLIVAKRPFDLVSTIGEHNSSSERIMGRLVLRTVFIDIDVVTDTGPTFFRGYEYAVLLIIHIFLLRF